MDSLFDSSEFEPNDSFFTLARSLSSAKGIPPSSHKKKRQDCGPRDSLARRLRVGNPGTRRYKNWELDQSLRFNLEESESSLSSDELDFEEKCQPSYGAFGLYFYDPALQSLLKPFLDVTEEEERVMQGFDDSSSRYEPDHQSSSPADSFNLLKLQSQRLLRKHSDRHFVTEMDRQIFEFCVGSSTLSRFEFDSSFTRYLAHAVSEYYGLICFSRKAKNGKITFVEKRSDFIVPLTTLSAFLTTLPPLD